MAHRWGFKLPDGRTFRWYEVVWAALPIGLIAIGGALGGILGTVAAGLNLKLMASRLGATRRFLLAGLISVVSVALYLIVDTLLLGLLPTWMQGPERIDRALSQTPIYAAIRKADPQAYDAIRSIMLEGTSRGKSQLEVNREVRARVGAVMKRSLPIASDAAVIDITRLVTLEIDQIGAKSLDACYDFVFATGRLAAVDVTAVITPEVLKLEMRANQAVIESALTKPRPVPGKDEVSAALQEVVKQLVDEYGAANVGALAQPSKLGHAKACSMTSALYKHVLELPAKDAGPLLRFLFAQQPAA